MNKLQSAEHLTHPKYRPDIDGLRAVAILSVVLYHAFPGWIKGGFIGVDIFFVISGYLISTIIIDSLERNSFSFIEFYIRRINRIFPALLLVLIACYVFGWFALLADEYKQLGKHIAGGAGFVSNLLLWGESGYFDNAAETKPLLHLWSLGIEEQFYIAWPLILWIGWKQRFNLLTIAVIVATMSFLLNISYVRDDAVAAFYSPQTRFWELMVGSILAYMTLHRLHNLLNFKHWLDVWLGKLIYAQAPEQNGKTLSNVQSLFGAALIVCGVFIITKERNFPGWWAVLPTLGAVMIISAGAQAWLNRVVLSNRIMVWVGLISFPLYLWHWPLLSYARIIQGETLSREIRISVVLLAVVLAWLTYRVIEKPFRFDRNGKVKAGSLLCLMVVIGYVGYNSYIREGLGFRIKNNEFQHRQLLQLNWDGFSTNVNCTAKYPSSQFCEITNIGIPPTAVIIGDSHSNHFFWGLSDYLKRNRGNLLNIGAGGCLPFFEIGGSAHPTQDFNCYSRIHDMYDFILHDANIKTVYLSFHHSAYFQKFVRFTDYLNQINNKDNNVNVQQAFIRTILILNSTGKKVVVIYDTPDLNVDIKTCINVRPLTFTGNPCKSSSVFIEDFTEYDLMLSEASKMSSFSVFYTHQFLEGNYPINKDGIPTYRDNTHLSMQGSLFLAEKYTF